jgi:hypothetical protein
MRRRLRIYFYWRDLWLGVYVAPDAIYVCPLPTLVIRWQRMVCMCGIDQWPAPAWGDDNWPEHQSDCPMTPVSAIPDLR